MAQEVENIQLRAIEPADLEMLYHWENDPAVWRVSGTMAPISRDRLARFISEQVYDLYATRQMRLMVDVDNVAVGCVDIFDFEPLHRRFGIGILIYADEHRRRGYARRVIDMVKEYARNTLDLRQIWVTIDENNPASVALFEGCGFTLSARRREWINRGGKFIDELEYQCFL
jgi:diamine N-acetyltransferase